MASATSTKIELKLTGIARASLEELRIDFEDYLRQHGLELWPRDHPKAIFIRRISSLSNRSYSSYKSYIEEKSAETAANTLLCLINQTTYLLRRQLARLGADFERQGGFTERMHRLRKERK